jgi:hypothetical protein
MDGSRFDSIVRSFASAHNRRQVIRGLLGIGSAVVAGQVGEASAARRPTPPSKPVQCPGIQQPDGDTCICPGDLTKCGPACCETEAQCCDNACCPTGSICIGEETCCTPVCDGSTCGGDGCGGTCSCTEKFEVCCDSGPFAGTCARRTNAPCREDHDCCSNDCESIAGTRLCRP